MPYTMQAQPARARPANPESNWRIAAPLLSLTLFTPCLVLAYACTTDQGPWASDGYFGPGTFADTLLLLSPLALWAWCWMWTWKGDCRILLESRMTVCLYAAIAGFAVCGVAWLNLVSAEWGSWAWTN
jgi:hypothetical protein